MPAMTERAKARLREIALEKRKKNPLAKDYDVTDWLVMSDKVKEDFPHYEPPLDYFSRPHHPGRVLKYVPNEVIKALGEMLPTVQVRYSVGPGRARTTLVFPSLFIYQLLKELGLNVDKYTTCWDAASQERCRVAR